MGLLENKVGIVTGGGSGLGRATALLAAREGSRVTVADIREEPGKETVELVRKAGGEALFVRADVSDEAQVEQTVARTVASFGALHWASNNAAGGGGFGPLHEVDERGWRRTLDVCLTGVFYCMKHEIRVMLGGGGGSIVNVTSVAGLKGESLQAAYASSKGGVEALTKTGATEYATRGIRVNSVAPGGMETPAVERYFAAFPDIRDRTIGAHAMRRLADPEEVAQAVVWLASDRASFATGSCMIVDGGCWINSHML